MRPILAAIIFCLLLGSATDADARSRKHRQTREDRLIELLRSQSAEIKKLDRKITELNSRIFPDAPRADISVPLPPPSNRLLAMPSPIPTVPAIAPKVLGNIAGMNQAFVAKLATMRADMPDGMGFKVGSGFRTHSQQARLHRAKPRLAARPGHSNHERGLAADLDFSSPEAKRWVHRNARKYALRFPMGYEPWHIEPEGLTRYAKHHRRTRYATAR